MVSLMSLHLCIVLVFCCSIFLTAATTCSRLSAAPPSSLSSLSSSHLISIPTILRLCPDSAVSSDGDPDSVLVQLTQPLVTPQGVCNCKFRVVDTNSTVRSILFINGTMDAPRLARCPLPTFSQVSGTALVYITIGNFSIFLQESQTPFSYYGVETAISVISYPVPELDVDPSGYTLSNGVIQFLDAWGNSVPRRNNSLFSFVSVSPPLPANLTFGLLTTLQECTLGTGCDGTLILNNSYFTVFDALSIQGARGSSFSLTVNFAYRVPGASSPQIIRSLPFGVIQIPPCTGPALLPDYNDPTGCTCAAGYTTVADSSDCTMCDVFSFKPQAGRTACTQCPLRAATDPTVPSTNMRSCLCAVGYVNSNLQSSGTVNCKSCPTGGVCAASGLDPVSVPAAPTYWRPVEPGLRFYRCESEGCSGGIGDSSCTNGYVGVLCANCDSGYVRAGNACLECPSAGAVVVLVLLLVLLFCALFAFLALVITSSEKSSSFVAKPSVQLSDAEASMTSFRDTMAVCLRILVVHVQSLSIVLIYRFGWSTNVRQFFAVMSALTVNIKFLVNAFNCSKFMSFYSAWALRLCLVFILAGIAWLLFLIVRGCLSSRFKRASALLKRFTTSGMLARLQVLTLYILHPFVAYDCMSVLPCVSVGLSSYLIQDTDVSCTSNGYNGMVAIAMIVLIAYTVGFPLSCFTVLWKNATMSKSSSGTMPQIENLSNADDNDEAVLIDYSKSFSPRAKVYTVRVQARDMLAALVHRGLRPEAWWFECTILLRQILLVALAVMSTLKSDDENHDALVFDFSVTLSVGMLVIFITIVLTKLPYQAQLGNVLQGLSTLILFTTFVGASLITDNPSFVDLQTAVTIMIILTHIIFVAAVAALLVWTWWKVRHPMAAEEEADNEQLYLRLRALKAMRQQDNRSPTPLLSGSSDNVAAQDIPVPQERRTVANSNAIASPTPSTASYADEWNLWGDLPPRSPPSSTSPPQEPSS